ncbi:MAG TPA: dihydrolipoamide acetyltransferase family protein [Saprospiraceae bacterium]|nr:dihydrolipoamide acetyltransferase family protein [Saprospiraceae bacterium]HNT21670.1 dihydrolipoamide acetyltransferase family protein [Saprospiraceae bacterium]
MEHDLIMPRMGESITEATILRWLLREGDEVDLDQPVLEIATDKVDSEIPSPVKGKISRVLFAENEVVPVGATIALIQVDSELNLPEIPTDEIPMARESGPVETQVSEPVPYVPPMVSPPEPEPAFRSAPTGSGRFYSPLVRTIAREENISLEELDKLDGSGQEGRVTKQDILNYVDRKKKGLTDTVPPPVVFPQPTPVRPGPVITGEGSGGQSEIIEMDRMRRLIADHMVHSKHTAPHVTSFVEVDLTELVHWRNKVKSEFQKKYNQNLTFTPIFMQAVVEAIRAYPLLNSSVDGYKIIRKQDIHIGMATALPSGNLIVPVIRHADRLNLQGLALAINDLAARARAGQLKPEEVAGGTFTLTNVGSFGSLMGTPIINQPQVAILATGSIKKKPAVLETVHGDVIAIRHMMFMSMSYDHRVIDGFLGGSFLRKVADLLENFDIAQSV